MVNPVVGHEYLLRNGQRAKVISDCSGLTYWPYLIETDKGDRLSVTRSGSQIVSHLETTQDLVLDLTLEQQKKLKEDKMEKTTNPLLKIEYQKNQPIKSIEILRSSRDTLELSANYNIISISGDEWIYTLYPNEAKALIEALQLIVEQMEND